MKTEIKEYLAWKLIGWALYIMPHSEFALDLSVLVVNRIKAVYGVPKMRNPPKPPEKKFTIEHYPYSGFYCVRYKNKGWLKTELSGIVRVDVFFAVCHKAKSLEECDLLITLYKEQEFKQGVFEVQSLD